ncbi:MAG: hypothetical protein OXH13_08955 [Chloroflexi bacterium]|nr:hypothetical protein [Chloroflexota bacterium]MCY3697599.1 hypothetical protein [Chloroflexota bacterium]
MPRPSEALMNEAGEWIAEQLSEEGLMVTSGFVDLVLDMEWTVIEEGVDPDARSSVVDAVMAKMIEENVQVGPPLDTLSTDGIDTSQIRPVPRGFVEQVLSWEDDFLGFAGVKRADVAG